MPDSNLLRSKGARQKAFKDVAPLELIGIIFLSDLQRCRSSGAGRRVPIYRHVSVVTQAYFIIYLSKTHFT
jgi:hypothetical protein